MPRGGYRLGSGRPRKVQPRAVTELREFGLVDHLSEMPVTPRGRRHRVVLALAAYDAPRAVIAAALSVPEAEVAEVYSAELAIGEALQTANMISAVWDKARAGDWQTLKWLLRRIENREDNNRST